MDRVEQMFHPDNLELWPNLNLASPEGLTLTDIEFQPEALMQATDLMEELPVGPPPDPEIVTVRKIDW